MEEDKKIVLEENENEQHPQKLPYVMLTVLVLLILALIALISNAVSDFSEKFKSNSNTSNQPVRAFSEQPKTRKSAVLPKTNSQSNFEQIRENTTEPVTIAIHPLESYNGNTKSEMYDIRKSYVKTSLFYTPDYEPNEEIFGRIEDGKQWWALDKLICSREGEDTTPGLSAMSRFINNPDILVPAYFSFNLTYRDIYKEYCNGNFSRNIPKEAFYNPIDNTITVKYPMSTYVTSHKVNHFSKKATLYPLILSGINAKDFGYNYVYINNKYNISMVNEDNNASQKIHKFLDYIHVGGSCRHPDGCNNISPYQPELEFVITSLPAGLTLKLWKKEPITKEFSADINYKIIFEEDNVQ